MLEVYNETPIFIPLDIVEEVVKLVTRTISVSSGPGGTNLEDLHVWLLKLREYRKKLCISVEKTLY